MSLAADIARLLPRERPQRTATERAGGPSTVRVRGPYAPKPERAYRVPGFATPEQVDAALDRAWEAWGARHGHNDREVRRRRAFVVRAIQRRRAKR